MRWLAETIDKGTNQQSISQGPDQAHGNIGRIQIGHNQDIGATLQIGLGIHRLAQLGVQGAKHMHFAINLQVWVSISEHFTCTAHLFCRGGIRGTKVRVRQQRDFRFNTKALDQINTGLGNFYQFSISGVHIHRCISQK